MLHLSIWNLNALKDNEYHYLLFHGSSSKRVSSRSSKRGHNGVTKSEPNSKMFIFIWSLNTQTRTSSAGTIKRSVTKVPSEGLIVLPPDKELVKFENGSISTPDFSTDCGSVGRLERSLQMARKKELEDEISTKVSASGELTKEEEKSRPLKQAVKLDAQVGHDDEDSESSESDSSDNDEQESNAEGGIAQAPLELKGEFLKAVMDEDYENAKELCQKILLLEPDNKTCSEFHAVIVEKMKQEDEESDDSESESTEESSDESEGEDENQEGCEDDQGSDNEDANDDESNSDDDFTLPPGPINLIMGGLPIRPQNR